MDLTAVDPTAVAVAVVAVVVGVIYWALYVEGSFTPAQVPPGPYKDDAKVRPRKRTVYAC